MTCASSNKYNVDAVGVDGKRLESVVTFTSASGFLALTHSLVTHVSNEIFLSERGDELVLSSLPSL